MKDKKAKILYVDDLLINRELFNESFKDKFDIILADSGISGLEAVKTNELDLILTDLRMPIMSGIKFLQEVIKINDKPPRILVTAHNEVAPITEAINSCKIYYFIQRPWDKDSFLIAMNKAIEHYRTTKENESLSMQLQKLTATQKKEIEEKKTLLLKLSKSEEKFRTIFENSVVGFIRTAPLGNIIMGNKTLMDMLGHSSLKDLQNRNLLSDIFVESEAQSIFYELLSNKGKILDLESIWLRKDFSELNVSISFRIINDEKGKIQYLEGSVVDITQRKKTEKGLRNSEARLREAQKIGHIGHWSINHRANTMHASDEVYRIFGIIPQEKGMDLKKLEDYIHPDEKEYIINSLKNSIQNKTRYKVIHRIVREDSSIGYVMAQCRTNYDKANNPRSTFGIIQDITEQSITQQNLIKEKNISDNSINSLPGIFYIFNNKGKLYRWNKKLELVTGFSPREIDKMSPTDFVDQEDLKKVTKAFKEVFKKGEIYLELKIKTKDGQQIPYLFTGSLVEIEQEAHLVGMGIDISKRVMVEDELKKYKKQLENLVNIRTLEVGRLTQALEQNPALITITDDQGIIEYVNNTFSVQTGYDASELIHKKAPFLEKDKIPKDVYKQLWHTISNGKNWTGDLLIRKKNGDDYWVSASISPLFNRHEEIESYISVLFDITEAKKAQNELKERKQYLQMLQDESPVGLVLSSLDGKFIEVNNAFTEITGLSIKEALGLSMKDITPSKYKSNEQEQIAKLNIAGRYGPYEKEIIHKKGYSVPVRLSGLIIERKDKGYIWSSVENITSQKEFEKKLQNARIEAEVANKTKSEFLANMSHEIRTPLNAVLGIADLLHQQITNNVHRNYIKTILSSGKSLLTIINDILDLSKIEAGKLLINNEYVNLLSILNEVGKIFSLEIKEKELEFKFNFDSNLPEVIYIDEIRIRQVLINLMSNAIKFTNKGFVGMSIHQIGETNIKKKIINLCIKIEDSGIGIDNDFIRNIFESFSQQEGQDTKKYGGSGLGLAISLRLIELMNGKLLVDSTKGKGSTFTIELNNVKYYEGKHSKSEENTGTKINKYSFAPCKILLVDDIDNNRVYLSGIFRNSMIQVTEAINGSDALEKIKVEKPDLIITDILMPVMNGFELSTRVKSDYKDLNIPIIANSAAVMSLDSETLENADFDEFLPKPINVRVLFSMLAKYLPLKKERQVEDMPDFIIKSDSVDHNALPELVKELRELLNAYNNNLVKYQPMNEVEEFSQKISSIAEKYNSVSLTNYSKEIKDSIKSFDIDTMLKLIRKFPTMVKSFLSIDNTP